MERSDFGAGPVARWGQPFEHPEEPHPRFEQATEASGDEDVGMGGTRRGNRGRSRLPVDRRIFKVWAVKLGVGSEVSAYDRLVSPYKYWSAYDRLVSP